MLLKVLAVLFGLGCLVVGVGSVLLLLRIHGSSDGPGALFFYIGAFFGLSGAFGSFRVAASLEA
jgi:hypothetical protein